MHFCGKWAHLGIADNNVGFIYFIFIPVIIIEDTITSDYDIFRCGYPGNLTNLTYFRLTVFASFLTILASIIRMNFRNIFRRE